MALFRGISNPLRDQADQYFRSNSKLQAGTHDSPGEKFKVDPRLKGLFKYHFGGDGWVVIPKGRVVSVATSGDNDSNVGLVNGQVKDPDTGFYKPALTIANGGNSNVTRDHKNGLTYTSEPNKPIGVAYGNIYEEFALGFNGMQPTIENEVYIELPLFDELEHAEAIEWGSAYGSLEAGDFVMSDAQGRVVKADFDGVRSAIAIAKTNEDVAALADAITELSRLQEQVIGQVWAVEKIKVDGKYQAPEGWLKWVSWSEEDMRQDDRNINNSGFRAEDIAAQDGFPGYPYEATYKNYDFATKKYQPKGIPGLTDGANIEVEFVNELIGTLGNATTGRYDFRLKNIPAVAGSVSVTVGSTAINVGSSATVNGATVKVEYVNNDLGLVVIDVTGTLNAAAQVKVSYSATNQVPGVPTGWDWKNSVGAVRILLQK